VIGGVFGCLALCTALLLVASVPDPVALGFATVAAVVPALFYSMLVLYLDRYEPEPWYLLLAAFFWGAVVAVVFTIIFGLITGSIVIVAWGEEAYEFFSLVIGAPVIEETTKGAALLALLLLFRHAIDSTLDGIVYGGLVGLGFAMTENILYFGSFYLEGGLIGLGFGFFVRSVMGGFAHAIFTASTGAAIGWARGRYGNGLARFFVPAGGLLLAILQHALWNGTAWGFDRVTGGEPSLLAFLLISFFMPAVLILPQVTAILIYSIVTGRRQLKIIREHLVDEVGAGVLSTAELAVLTTAGQRRRASWNALMRGGPPGWFWQRRFARLASTLAFQKFHERQGEAQPSGFGRKSNDELRAELASTRNRLAAAV
jgi:protease PrsW